MRYVHLAAPPTPSDIMGAVVSGLAQSFVNQYNTATIITTATPPVDVDLRAAMQSGPPNPVLAWLKPTVVLRGPSGEQVIAPYGISQGSTGGPLLLVLGLVGVGFVLGRL